MKRSLLEYVKTLEESNTGGSTGTGPGPGRSSLTIKLDPNGYPILPSPESWEETSKDELENLYRDYMTIHYSE